MYKVKKEDCTGCTVCVSVCPQEAIEIKDGKAEINPKDCVDCGKCAEVCPMGAIYFE